MLKATIPISSKAYKLLGVGMFLFSLVLLILIMPKTTNALDGSQFNPGRIIDDAIFYNKDAMSADQIQQFLNAKAPICDTNHAKSGSSNDSGPPYVCLKDYKQNTTNIGPESGLCNGYIGNSNESAAQIIYKVAQSCGISPQVILVMLQKEQGLVTDTWPWEIQYRKAMGAFCPDTAPCDPTYAGFFYQVYYGAHRFKVYAANPNSYNYKAGRNNFILYNPNTSCGGSNVYIQNQATANLYIYTPYQPNPATLAVGLGVEAPCGAYGNKNFWWYFNSWFGSTHGSLIRTVPSNDLYYTDGNYRFVVPSMSLIEQYGLGLNDVRFVTQQELDGIPLANSPYSTTLGQVIKSNDDSDEDGGSLYLVSRGYRIPIQSMSQFESFGFTEDDITYLPLSSVLRLVQSETGLSNYVQAPDLSVYRIQSGQKKVIFELSKLASLNPSGNITKLSTHTLNTWEYGTPEVDGNYVVIDPGGGIRLYRGGNYNIVPNLSVYDCWKLSSLKTFKVGSYAIVNGSSGGNLGCFAEDSMGNEYIMGSTAKYLLPEGHELTTPLHDDALISRLPTGTLKPVIKGSGPALAVFENGKRRSIPNMYVYSELGYNSSSITVLPQAAFTTIPLGAMKLSIGSLILENNGAISVTTSDTTRRSIVSVTQFNYFSFNWSRLIRATSSDLVGYTSEGNLPYYFNSSGKTYLVDDRVRYLISSDLDEQLNIDRDTLPTLDPKLISNTIPWNMTRFIKNSSQPAVYYLENGMKRPVNSWQRVEELGGANSLLILSNFRVGSFSTGSTI